MSRSRSSVTARQPVRARDIRCVDEPAIRPVARVERARKADRRAFVRALQFEDDESRRARFPLGSVAASGANVPAFQEPNPPKNMPNFQFLTRRFLFIFVLALVAIASTVATQARSSPLAPEKQQKQGKHDKQDDEDTPLERAMQSMQNAQKRLEKVLASKDLAGALPLVLDMQRATIAARVETPPRAQEINDAAKRAEFLAGFRKQLITLDKALCDLETAAIDGKLDEATHIYDSVVKPMKKDGHAKYKGD
jgi:hypothetical protein